MNLTVTIGTRDIACEFAEKRQMLIRGMQRPAIEFTFPDGAIKLDTLRNLVNDETKTQTITIVNNDPLPVIDEDGNDTGQTYIARETLEGYTVRSENCIQLKTVEVEEATYESPAVYEDKIVLQLGLKFGWEA